MPYTALILLLYSSPIKVIIFKTNYTKQDVLYKQDEDIFRINNPGSYAVAYYIIWSSWVYADRKL